MFLLRPLSLLAFALAAFVPANATLNYTTPYVFTTIAGAPDYRSIGTADGPGATARFFNPEAIVLDATGNLFVADGSNATIRKITPTGNVTTFVGVARDRANIDGNATTARFNHPEGLAIDASGNLYVSDTSSELIRKITPTGNVTTLAGVADFLFYQDGPAASAMFNTPTALAIDSSGRIFIADQASSVIRLLSPAGTVSTWAGKYPSSGPRTYDGIGTAATFMSPTDVAFDPSGNLIVADISDWKIRKITPTGSVSTLVGDYEPTGNEPENRDGPGATAGIAYPNGVAVDASGNIFVCSFWSGLIRKITPAGEVSTIGGNVNAGPSGTRIGVDGIGQDAIFETPERMVVGADGTLYITDGQMIRKGRPAKAPAITAQPQSLTVATGGSVQFSVTVAGAPDPTYQWYFNGGAFSGATSNTLSFSNARTTDAGDYTVVITNSLGAVTSNKATLTVSAGSTGGGSGSGTPSNSSSGGGGGAPSAFFLLVLGALAACRHATASARKI